MSFVKKAIKKVWNFVKDYWKEIALVAAVVFTAGIATIGFAAFAGVSSVGGFFSAVGSTMWAGVAGVAGSMGIGSGAAVPAGSALAAQGVTHVGFGASWGLGGGYGLGAAGKAAAAQAAAAAAEPALAAGSVVGAEGTGIGVGSGAGSTNLANTPGMMPGMTSTSPSAMANNAAAYADKATALSQTGGKTMTSPITGKAVPKEIGDKVITDGMTDNAVKEGLKKAGEGGLSDTAWKTLGVLAPIGGAAMAALGDEPEFYDVPYYGINEKTGEGMGGKGGGGALMALPAGDTAGPGEIGGGTEAADSMFKGQMQRSQQSIAEGIMGNPARRRGWDGRLLNDPNNTNRQPLMEWYNNG